MKQYYLNGILLCLSLFLGFNASAYEAEIDGIYYNFSGNEALVTYKDYSYNSYSGDVVIPASVTYESKTYSVTSIGDGAFSDCYSLTSVTIPNNVTSIGQYAFSGCSGLTSITIPHSVTSIGKSAFYGCTGLTSIIIPNGVTVIYEYTFYNCSSLTSIMIPEGVTFINPGAFRGCSSLTSIIIPEGVTGLGGDTFSGCSSLTSVSIPNSMTIIGGGTFSGCSSLTSITIGSGVTSIGNSAFYGCTGLTSITIGNSVTSIGFDAFSNCSSLTSVHITDLAAWCNISFSNSISNPLFCAHHLYLNGEEIKDLVIPEGVTSIGHYAFSGCSGLNSITIPNSVTSIGGCGFYNCDKLSSVTIGCGVTSIGSGAFQDCASLTSIEVEEGNPRFDSRDNCNAIIETSSNTLKIACRSSSIPNSVTSIGSSAFYNCTGLTSITIPNSVTSIGSNAFYNCTGLTSITIPNSVTSIADYAFSSCSSLTSVIIGSGVTNIGSSAFSGCTGLTSVIIGSGVTSIDGGAFSGCTSLTSIVIPNSVTRIREFTFRGCSNLNTLTIGSGITEIGSYAFSDCKLRNVLIKCAIPPTVSSNIFSNQTYYHTTLYIPTGYWDAYAYDDNWYKFINIRETATSEEQVSEQQAYTLMDANTFTYSVYDPVNDCIGTIGSVAGINEDNPNHCWQVIETGSTCYLYNLGAKKYVKRTGNSLALTDVSEPIEIEDGNNGIIFGEQTANQWALVSNERMNINQSVLDEVTGIVSPFGKTGKEQSYDLSGRKLDKPQKGINIIRYSDGTSRKVLVK